MSEHMEMQIEPHDMDRLLTIKFIFPTVSFIKERITLSELRALPDDIKFWEPLKQLVSLDDIRKLRFSCMEFANQIENKWEIA